jgi:septal ring factor EnvC (AmiA/AmiB activator)
LILKTNVKKAELEAQEKKNRALMDEIKTNKKTHEQALEELNLRARQLQELLQKLEKQEFLLPFPLVPFYEKKGKLPWPAGGKIIQQFGIQRHPRFNTVTMNSGIEIAPAKNDLIVRAVHPGKVVFADYFQGYGNLLIIDHGMTYYSLYGHCAAFLVQNGDVVRTDQPIAEAGETGSLAGNISLYFEIRYRTKPLDPLQWLARR